MLSLEANLDSIMHMQEVRNREVVASKAQAVRLKLSMIKEIELAKKHLAERPQVHVKLMLEKLSRSLNRFQKNLETRTERLQTITLWQVVMLVTCVEAYLQDVLTTAASVDPELMNKSEQCAQYADIIGATSLDALANELRARWARGWLSDGGPTRWIARLGKMGARGYPKDLARRLEPIWGIRHVVVHAAGVATPDFVKRHPGMVKAAGNRVRVSDHDSVKFVKAIQEFLDPTDGFFLARYPSMLAVRTTPAKL